MIIILIFVGSNIRDPAIRLYNFTTKLNKTRKTSKFILALSFCSVPPVSITDGRVFVAGIELNLQGTRK